MMKKLLPVLLCIALLLSGCSVTENNISSQNSTENQSVSISFSWWGNDKRHEYTMKGIGIFEEENPEIKVKKTYGVWQGYEKRMNVAMKSHTEADIMQINYAWLDEYSKDGEGFYDLNMLSDIIDLSNYTENDLQYGIKNGKLNALPIAFNAYEFYYNADIWDKYGLEFPDDWDDFFTAAEVMKADGIYPLGLVKKQAFVMTISWFEQKYGKHVFDDEGMLAINEKELSDMIEFYASLVKEKVIIPIEDFDKSKFAEGKVASTLCWVSDAGNYCEMLEKKGGTPKIGGFVIPEDSLSNGWYIKPATMYAISAYAENPKEAGKLLNFLLNDPKMVTLQLAEKGVPVSKTARETLKNIPDSDLGYEFMASEYMNDNIEKLTIMKPIMENDDIISAFKETGDEYLYNQMSLEDCSKQLHDTIMDICGEELSTGN